MQSIQTLLIAGVILGVSIISLGLIVNIIQNLWVRNYKEAIFGEWAGSSLLFYWGAIFLFYMVSRGVSTHAIIWLMALVLLPPLFGTVFGAEIWDRLTGKGGTSDPTGAISRPIELMLGSLTNTVSFARVPAFALNHAALMATVFVIGDLFKGTGGGVTGAIVSGTNAVLGNILVLGLEGLVVFVQVMRLQYYEFFGKFFHHQGRPFEPLSLRDWRSVA